MTVIPGADAVRIQMARKVVTELVLNIAPLQQVASATITQTPTYPVTQLAVGSTSGWNNCSVGRAFAIKRGDTIILWGVQRLPVTSTAFYPDVKSAGDSGYAADIGRTIQAGDTLHVYRHRPPWGLLSRATADAQFKKWDVPYDTSGTRPQPVVNMGSHRQAFAGANNRATFNFSAAASFDWLGGVAGISSVLWSFPAGTDYLAGSPTSKNVTVSIPTGFYQVGCSVTSVNGRAATGWRWVFVNNRDPGSQYAPVSMRYPIDALPADKTDRHGAELTIDLLGDARSLLYPGALVLMNDRVTWDGEPLPADCDRNTAVCYIDEMASETEARLLQTTTISARSPLKVNIPTATQLVEEHASPLDWTQVRPGLSHPAFAAYYILKHHTTLLDICDFIFDPALKALRRRLFGFQHETIGAQLQLLESMMVGEVNCRSDGSLRLVREPNHLENDDKNALDEKFVWTDTTVRAPLSLNPRLHPLVASVIANAIAHDGSDEPAVFRAIAPGYAQAQGVARQDAPDIIVTAAGGQTELNRYVGHQWQYENNPLASMDLTPRSMADILEPADDDWHVLDISEDYLGFNPARFGIDWRGNGQGMRVRPIQVSRTWRQRNGVWLKVIEAEVRSVSHGQPGQYLPIDRDDALPWTDDGWLPDTDNIYQPDTPELDAFGRAIVWNSNGALARTEIFDAESVYWEKIDDGLAGAVVSACWDGTNDSGVWLLVYDADETRLRIYSTANVWAEDVVWTQQYHVSAPGFLGIGHIGRSSSSPVITLVKWKTNLAEYAVRRSGVGSWSSTLTVGSTVTDSGSRHLDTGLGFVGDTQIVGGRVGVGQYRLFRAAGTGAFEAVPGQPGDGGLSSEPITCIQVDGQNRVYARLNLYSSLDQVQQFVNTDFQLSSVGDPLPALSSAAANTLTQYGVYRRYRTPPQVDGKLHTVTALNVQVTTTVNYPASMAGEPPTYYPPDQASLWATDVNAFVMLLAADGTPIHYQSINWHTLDDPPTTITYAPSPQGFDRVLTTNSHTLTLPEPVAGVAAMEVYVRTVEPKNFFSGTFQPFVGGPHIDYFQVSATVSSMTVSNTITAGPRLYRIENITSGSPTWVDVTPPSRHTPIRQFALAPDVEASNRLSLIGSSSEGERTIQDATLAGQSWSSFASTRHHWLRRMGDTFVLGGDHRLDLSLDSRRTMYSRLGDWARSVGPVGTITGILAEVE